MAMVSLEQSFSLLFISSQLWDINTGKNITHLQHKSKFREVKPLICTSSSTFVAAASNGAVAYVVRDASIFASVFAANLNLVQHL